MDTNELVKNNLCYGITNKWGTWMYLRYQEGRYWFSKEFSVFSTPLTANDVKNIVYKK